MRLPLYFGLRTAADSLDLIEPCSDTVAMARDSSQIWKKVISESDLARFRDNPDFDYRVVETAPGWWDDLKIWLVQRLLAFLELIFGVGKATGILEVILHALPYLLLGLILWVLYRLFGRSLLLGWHNSDKKMAAVTASADDDLVKNADLDLYIQQAVAQGDYRLAIRYQYLKALQRLSEARHIKWEQQKTNDDYLNEIQSPGIRGVFAGITRLYDYFWYGYFPIDGQKYSHAIIRFDELDKTLGHD